MPLESDSPAEYRPQPPHPLTGTYARLRSGPVSSLPPPLPPALGLRRPFPSSQASPGTSAPSSYLQHSGNTLGLQLQASPTEEQAHSPHDNIALQPPAPVFAQDIDIPAFSVPSGDVHEGDRADGAPSHGVPETQVSDSGSWDMDHDSLFSGSSQGSADEQQEDVQGNLPSSTFAPSPSRPFASTTSAAGPASPARQQLSPLPGPYNQSWPINTNSPRSESDRDSTPYHTSRSSFTPATMVADISPATPLDMQLAYSWEASPMVADPTELPDELGYEYQHGVQEASMHSRGSPGSGDSKSSSQEAAEYGLETQERSSQEEVDNSMAMIPNPEISGISEDALQDEPTHHFGESELDSDDALDPHDGRLAATEQARRLYNDPSWARPYQCPGFTPSTVHGNIPCAYRTNTSNFLKKHDQTISEEDEAKNRFTGHPWPNPSLVELCVPKYACSWFFSPDGAGKRVFRCTHRADNLQLWESHIMQHTKLEIEGMNIARRNRMTTAGGRKVEKRIRCERCGKGVMPSSLKSHRDTVKCRDFVEDLAD